jgi:hypothetical protein
MRLKYPPNPLILLASPCSTLLLPHNIPSPLGHDLHKSRRPYHHHCSMPLIDRSSLVLVLLYVQFPFKSDGLPTRFLIFHIANKQSGLLMLPAEPGGMETLPFPPIQPSVDCSMEGTWGQFSNKKYCIPNISISGANDCVSTGPIFYHVHSLHSEFV